MVINAYVWWCLELKKAMCHKRRAEDWGKHHAPWNRVRVKFSFWSTCCSNFYFPENWHMFIIRTWYVVMWPGTVAKVTVIRQLSVVCLMPWHLECAIKGQCEPCWAVAAAGDGKLLLLFLDWYSFQFFFLFVFLAWNSKCNEHYSIIFFFTTENFFFLIYDFTDFFFKLGKHQSLNLSVLQVRFLS